MKLNFERRIISVIISSETQGVFGKEWRDGEHFSKTDTLPFPLELLSEHSKPCVKAANLMYTAVKKYLNNTSVDDLSKEVDKLEHAADQLKL